MKRDGIRPRIFFGSIEMKTSQTNKLIRKAIAFALIFCFMGANLAVTTVFAATNDQNTTAKPETNNLTTDLTQLGREGRLRENSNLEPETLQLIKVLSGNGIKQPMILDEKNENQENIVEQ